MAPQRSGMAVAAMVSGIVGLVTCLTVVPAILGTVFGFVARHQIRRSRGSMTGLGLARTGWITGLVGIVVGVLVWVALLTSANFDEVEGRGTQVGTCLDLDGQLDGEGFAVPTVDCDGLHDAEVFEVGWLNPTRDRTFPDAATLRDEARARCAGEPFADYVGVPADDSALEIDVLVPPRDQWSRWRGEYTCLALAPEGLLRASVHHSRR